MLFTLWGCIRYYGYVGVPIITHNFNSTSTVDHVLLLHLKTALHVMVMPDGDLRYIMDGRRRSSFLGVEVEVYLGFDGS